MGSQVLSGKPSYRFKVHNVVRLDTKLEWFGSCMSKGCYPVIILQFNAMKTSHPISSKQAESKLNDKFYLILIEYVCAIVFLFCFFILIV